MIGAEGTPYYLSPVVAGKKIVGLALPAYACIVLYPCSYKLPVILR